jgi:hypothetical protein
MTMLRDLGDGLVLRRATPADAEPLAAFNARIHAEPDATGPDEEIGGWTRDLFAGHPTFPHDDFLIVEDTRTGAIASSLNLISQTWSYAGVEFGVGRVELVGTAEAYRRRGLVRVQMDTVHEWSRARGELMQAITGIPWYYRQFGYEYAITLDGGRRAPRRLLPAPLDQAADSFRLRPATADDAPFLARVDAHGRRRYLLSAVRDEALWRYEAAGRAQRVWESRVLESGDGVPVGLVAHRPRLNGGTLEVRACELAPGASWLAVKDSLLRYLRATGEAYEQQPGQGRFDQVLFLFEQDHPLYDVAQTTIADVLPPYAWYVRVPDVPAFLTRIAPVLDQRLAASVAAGYTGEVRLSFFRDGVRLGFRHGRLAQVERWPRPERHLATASFPDLTFLQLLCGHRSFEELRSFFPDCAARTDEARVLLAALFPKQPSLVWGVA